MRINILPNRDTIINEAVSIIINRLQNSQKKHFVLGLSTGATVLSICEQLALVIKEKQISLKNVVVFYAGEFIGYSQFMKHQYFHLIQELFFAKVDIPFDNIHSLNGNNISLEQECKHYETLIASYGGIDLFVGSLGERGEIAFNTSGSALHSRTRVKTLSKESILADARFFEGDTKKVPTQTITMGIGTIFDSKEVMICVYGVNKAFATQACLEKGVSTSYPASQFQLHPNSRFLIDKVAGRLLNQIFIEKE